MRKKKGKVIVKKISILLLALALLFSGSGAAFAADEPAGLFALESAGTYDRFTNNAAGYSLLVDKGMSVDMSYAAVCAVLENDQKRIEIYKQDISSTGRAAYVNYSNKFLENTVNHRLEYNGPQKINGYDVTITAWSRDKLSGIYDDKNYYVCLEVPSGSYIYTIFIKASKPVYLLGGYNYLVDGFTVFSPTAAPFMRTSKAVDVENRGWNDETKAFYNEYFGTGAELTWGIFEPQTSSFNYDYLKYYEDTLNYEFPILLNYSEFQNTYKHPNLLQRLETAYANGKTLELTLQTTHKADGSNMVYDILNGAYDAFLTDYAQVVAGFGHPVLFRLGNEMNGDWCPYSSYRTSKDTMLFKEFYKYVYSFFEQADAQNVIWVWNPNCKSFPNFQWNNEMMYYPGDEYVDVVGMTAYNTGTYYSETGEKWQEFSELYNALYYRYNAFFKQPLMITEFASASTGGDKEQWVRNMFEDIEKYNRIKVAIWWDGCDWDANGNVARSYVMDETPALLEIFRQYLTPYSKDDWKDGMFG